jgi:hypothetical protein
MTDVLPKIVNPTRTMNQGIQVYVETPDILRDNDGYAIAYDRNNERPEIWLNNYFIRELREQQTSQNMNDMLVKLKIKPGFSIDNMGDMGNVLNDILLITSRKKMEEEEIAAAMKKWDRDPFQPTVARTGGGGAGTAGGGGAASSGYYGINRPVHGYRRDWGEAAADVPRQVGAAASSMYKSIAHMINPNAKKKLENYIQKILNEAKLPTTSPKRKEAIWNEVKQKLDEFAKMKGGRRHKSRKRRRRKRRKTRRRKRRRHTRRRRKSKRRRKRRRTRRRGRRGGALCCTGEAGMETKCYQDGWRGCT